MYRPCSCAGLCNQGEPRPWFGERGGRKTARSFTLGFWPGKTRPVLKPLPAVFCVPGNFVQRPQSCASQYDTVPPSSSRSEKTAGSSFERSLQFTVTGKTRPGPKRLSASDAQTLSTYATLGSKANSERRIKNCG